MKSLPHDMIGVHLGVPIIYYIKFKDGRTRKLR